MEYYIRKKIFIYLIKYLLLTSNTTLIFFNFIIHTHIYLV